MAAYGSTITDSVRDRVSGAILSYYLSDPKDKISTDILLHEGLIRTSDVKVADQILSETLAAQAEAEKARKTQILRALEGGTAPAADGGAAPDGATTPATDTETPRGHDAPAGQAGTDVAE